MDKRSGGHLEHKERSTAKKSGKSLFFTYRLQTKLSEAQSKMGNNPQHENPQPKQGDQPKAIETLENLRTEQLVATNSDFSPSEAVMEAPDLHRYFLNNGASRRVDAPVNSDHRGGAAEDQEISCSDRTGYVGGDPVSSSDNNGKNCAEKSNECEAEDIIEIMEDPSGYHETQINNDLDKDCSDRDWMYLFKFLQRKKKSEDVKGCSRRIKYGGSETKGEEENCVMKKKVYPRALMDFMGVKGKEKAKIGVKKFKGQNIEELKEKDSKVLVRVTRSIISKVAETLLPSDGKGLDGKC